MPLVEWLQKSIGGSISVGAGKVSGSLNADRDKMHADYAAVNEQSGLNAGDGGFNITVKGNTNLKGAVITSSAEESKNQLTTGSLTVSDIKNHAEYNASSMGLGVGVGDVGKTVDGLMSTGGNVVPSTEKSGDGLKANTPIVLSASGNDSSTTHSAIATGKITITNEAQQQQLTGKTADETVVSLNRDTNNTAGKLNNNFDKAQVEEAFTVTKAFINETSAFVANRAKEADAAKEKIKELEATREKLAQDPNATKAQLTAIDGEIALQTQAKLDAEKWGPGGTYGQAITVFQVAAGGNVTGGMTNLVQNAVVAYVQSLAAEEVKKIADSFMKDGKETADSQNIRTALHAIVGCAGAAATGQSCNSAAVGAASSVVLNNLISEIQKTDAEHMTAEQKENRKNLVGTVIGGIVAAAGGDAAVANNAAQIETENNSLGKSQAVQWIERLKSLNTHQANRLIELYREESSVLANAAANCQTANECRQLAAELKANGKFLQDISNAFAKTDPVRAQMYADEAKASKFDMQVADNRSQAFGINLSSAENAVYTVQGIKPGEEYAKYEQRSKEQFLTMLGAATLPFGGYLIGGSKLATGMVTAGAVGGGFDAAGQYVVNCTKGPCDISKNNFTQSIFAADTAMIAGPLVGPLSNGVNALGLLGGKASLVWSTASLGFATGYTNTTFNNHHYGEDKNARFAGALGAVAGAAGAAVLVSPLSSIINTKYGYTLNPAVPAQFQPAPSFPGDISVKLITESIANSPSFYDTPDRKQSVTKNTSDKK